MPDDLRRLLQAHAGDDNEVRTRVERLGVEDRQTLPGTVQRNDAAQAQRGAPRAQESRDQQGLGERGAD